MGNRIQKVSLDRKCYRCGGVIPYTSKGIEQDLCGKCCDALFNKMKPFYGFRADDYKKALSVEKKSKGGIINIILPLLTLLVGAIAVILVELFAYPGFIKLFKF